MLINRRVRGGGDVAIVVHGDPIWTDGTDHVAVKGGGITRGGEGDRLVAFTDGIHDAIRTNLPEAFR